MSLAKLNKILVILMKLYWHPAMSLAKLNKILVILMKLYWHPAMFFSLRAFFYPTTNKPTYYVPFLGLYSHFY
jgi:hypothetical protein